MNKVEIYSDLSFNFNTDFESILMESMIDEAEREMYSAHHALESYLLTKNPNSIDKALESLFAVLESNDIDEDTVNKECDDSKCKKKKMKHDEEKDDDDDEDDEDEDDDDKDDEDEDDKDDDEDAKESYLRSACEAADASFSQKLAAAWKSFKEKVIAFLSRVANSLKNIATKIQLAFAKNAKDDVEVSAGDEYILSSLSQISGAMSRFSISNDENEKRSSLEEIEAYINNANTKNSKNETATMSPVQIKTAFSNISATLKECQKALQKLDKEVNARIRSGESSAREDMAYARNQITSAMNVIRIATASIVKIASKNAKEIKTAKAEIVK